ncbi:hypothetical protein D3C86_1631570 [compost metagenome]
MLECILQRIGGLFPRFNRTDVILRHSAQLYANVFESKILVDLEDQIIHGHAFIKKLLFSAENMSIILREASHAH